MSGKSPWVWVIAIVVGLAALIGVVALVGSSDDSDQTVAAADWADRTCSAVGTWRGEMEAIVEDIRTPTAVGSGSEEPQSETPQGRTGLVRSGLERAVRATKTLVVALDSSGTPDTAAGAESSAAISAWADATADDLKDAEASLSHEADTLETALEQYATATRSVGSALATGVATFTKVAAADPELATALRDSPSCQALREEQTNS